MVDGPLDPPGKVISAPIRRSLLPFLRTLALPRQGQFRFPAWSRESFGRASA